METKNNEEMRKKLKDTISKINKGELDGLKFINALMKRAKERGINLKANIHINLKEGRKESE